MTDHTITTTLGTPIQYACLVNGQCKASGLSWMSMLVVRKDGGKRLMTLDMANRLIKVNGVPIVDWYAKMN